VTIIPFDQLQPETLFALIEEFVTRDGALHGHQDVSIDQKIAEVTALLKSGAAVVVFDEESESASIALAESHRREGRQSPPIDDPENPFKPDDFEPSPDDDT
jgi:uncharacterized protein YheU (UPF0270 family)